MLATLRRITYESSDHAVRTYHFSTDGYLDYLPGQFTELTLPGKHDSNGPMRQLTLSSHPDEELAAVTLDFAEYRSSFKAALGDLSPGDTFDVSHAMGDFVLPLDMRCPMVWIAGGIGITPFRSLAIAAKAYQGETAISFVHLHSKSHHHGLFRGVIGPQVSAYRESESRISAEELAGLRLGDDTLYYIAGPEQMVAGISQGLALAGVAKERIVYDAFLGY